MDTAHGEMKLGERHDAWDDRKEKEEGSSKERWLVTVAERSPYSPSHQPMNCVETEQLGDIIRTQSPDVKYDMTVADHLKERQYRTRGNG